MSDEKTGYYRDNRSGKPRQKIKRQTSWGSNTSHAYRSDNSIKSHASRSGAPRREENRSGTTPHYQFTYGVPGQETAFINTKKYLAEAAVTELDMGRFIYALVMHGTVTKFDEPTDPGKDATPHESKKFFEDSKAAQAKNEKWERDQASFIIKTKNFCSDAMLRELENEKLPKPLGTIIVNLDVDTLYKTLEGLAFHSISNNKQQMASLQASNWRLLMGIKLKPMQHIDAHVKKYKGQNKALKGLWGKFIPQKLVGSNKTVQAKAANEFEVAMFLGSVIDDPRYGPHVVKMQKDFYEGVDKYPDGIDEAAALLKHHHELDSGNSAYNASFAQADVDEYEYEDDDYDTDSDQSAEEIPQQQPQQSVGVFHQSQPHSNSKAAHKARKKAAKKYNNETSAFQYEWFDS